MERSVVAERWRSLMDAESRAETIRCALDPLNLYQLIRLGRFAFPTRAETLKHRDAMPRFRSVGTAVSMAVVDCPNRVEPIDGPRQPRGSRETGRSP